MFFFFNDTATTEIYTLSLHDALPISGASPVDTEHIAAACPHPGNPNGGATVEIGPPLVDPPVAVRVTRQSLGGPQEVVPRPVVSGVRNPGPVEQILVVDDDQRCVSPGQAVHRVTAAEDRQHSLVEEIGRAHV